MTAPQRPRRKNKGDRLLAPGATPAQVAVDHAIAPYDRAASQAENRWGIDRLPALVSTETARKYGYSLGRLNEAIDAEDAETASAWAAVCIRGLAVMEAEAIAAGHDKLPPDYFEIEHEGRIFAIMRDISEWQAMKRLRPQAVILSAQEVANAISLSQSQIATLDAIREKFPEAEVTKMDLNFEDTDLAEAFK